MKLVDVRVVGCEVDWWAVDCEVDGWGVGEVKGGVVVVKREVVKGGVSEGGLRKSSRQGCTKMGLHWRAVMMVLMDGRSVDL